MNPHDHEDVVPQPEDSRREPTRRAPNRSGRPRPGAPAPLPGTSADVQLMERVLAAHHRVSLLPPERAAEHEAELASLECDLAARGLQLPPQALEPMPQQLAMGVLLRAVRKCDRGAAERALRRLDFPSIWIAYRRVRACDERDFRVHCLLLVLYRLDRELLGARPASERRHTLRDAALEPEDREALIEQCITSMFALALSRGSAEGGAR